jgi:hypothetical protein
MRLAYKEWRVRFRVEARTIEVVSIASGYRHSQLYASGAPASLEAHRAFVERFG